MTSPLHLVLHISSHRLCTFNQENTILALWHLSAFIALAFKTRIYKPRSVLLPRVPLYEHWRELGNWLLWVDSSLFYPYSRSWVLQTAILLKPSLSSQNFAQNYGSRSGELQPSTQGPVTSTTHIQPERKSPLVRWFEGPLKKSSFGSSGQSWISNRSPHALYIPLGTGVWCSGHQRCPEPRHREERMG